MKLFTFNINHRLENICSILFLFQTFDYAIMFILFNKYAK